MKICSKCGEKFESGKFCKVCGGSLVDEAENAKTDNETSAEETVSSSEELGEQEVYKKTIELLINDRTLASKIECNLNVLPPHTMGGKVWYNELFEFKGWRFQQNNLFKFVRLLDADDNCIAWGDRKQLLRKCRRLLQNI